MKTIINYPILSILAYILINIVIVYFGRIFIPEFFIPTAPIISQTWLFSCIFTGTILAIYLILFLMRDFYAFLMDEIWWAIYNIKNKNKKQK